MRGGAGGRVLLPRFRDKTPSPAANAAGASPADVGGAPERHGRDPADPSESDSDSESTLTLKRDDDADRLDPDAPAKFRESYETKNSDNPRNVAAIRAIAKAQEEALRISSFVEVPLDEAEGGERSSAR